MSWTERTALLIGEGALARLNRAHVLCMGLGGVGGIAAELLCRSGVGQMTIVDGDTIDESNRNRQIPALLSTTGRKKTEVMQERLRDINPDLKLNVIPDFVTAEAMADLLNSSKFDCVLDAIDSIAPKVNLIRLCLEKQIPIVSSMGSGARLDPEKIHCADLTKTFNCTLARAVRQGLKKMNASGKGCRAIFSEEPPIRSAVLDTGTQLRNKRSTTGTISYMPTLFGCHCTAEVIRLIIKEQQLSKLTEIVNCKINNGIYGK